jgi:outer membrane protein assembly factor BamB
LADLFGNGRVEGMVAYTDKAHRPHLTAIRFENGQVLWTQPLKLLRPYVDEKNRLWQTPEHSILLGLDTGFAALDPNDGHILWERPGRLTDALLTSWQKEPSLLLGFQEDGLRCLDLKGNQRWAFGFSEDVGPRLVLSNADGAGHDGVVRWSCIQPACRLNRLSPST